MCHSGVATSTFFLLFFLGVAVVGGNGPAKDSKLPPLDPKAFDRAAAAHLLARPGFGGTPEEIEALTALGLEKAVDRLLAPSDGDTLPAFEPTSPGRPSPRDLAGLSKEERQKKVREATRNDGQDLQRLRG